MTIKGSENTSKIDLCMQEKQKIQESDVGMEQCEDETKTLGNIHVYNEDRIFCSKCEHV